MGNNFGWCFPTDDSEKYKHQKEAGELNKEGEPEERKLMIVRDRRLTQPNQQLE